MKILNAILFLSFLLLSSCEDADAPRDDETNRYYADLLKIHNNYNSVGNDSTLLALEAYLEEFPELPDAYLFKAYILGSTGKIDEAYKVFEVALDMDSGKIESYEQYSSFLIYDTLNRTKCESILNKGMVLSDSSAILFNNFAWFELLNGNVDASLDYLEKGLKLNSKHLNLTRSFYVACLIKNEEELLKESQEALLVQGFSSSELAKIDTIVKTEGPYVFLKTLLK